MENRDNLHAGHRDRMRKRFEDRGFDGFADHEILEFLLFHAIPRKNTNELASLLLQEFNTLANIFEADKESLKKVPGVGEVAASFITIVPHLARVYERACMERGVVLRNTTEMGAFAISMMRGRTGKEELGMICLESNRRVKWHGIISAKGTLDHIAAYPREVVAEVLKHHAKNVIFVHNHPTGSLLPSPSDKETTRRLVDALKAIDVVTLDHIIVSDNRFYSMAESGFTF